MKEERRDISGYEDRYQVSKSGKIRSLRVINTSHKYDRYLKVCISNSDCTRKTVRIHRVVAETFLADSMSEGLVVNHKDGNRRNNSVENLEWITQKDNIAHAIMMGLNNIRGESNSRAKLNNKLVLEIRKMSSDGATVSAIASKLNYNYNTILDVVRFKTWKDVK